jgi:ribonuclease J
MKNKTNNYIVLRKEGEYFIPLCGTQEVGCNANIARVTHSGKTEQIIVDAGLGMLKDQAGINHCIPDYSCVDPRITKGIVITHGHLDHFGSLTYLLRHLRSPDIPIYATPFTMHIIKKQLLDNHITANLITVEMNSAFKIGEFFEIQLISVTHSVPETQMITISYKPSGINLLHTADYKIDRDPVIGQHTNEALLKQIGDSGVHCLVSDSTNANQIDWSMTEGSAQVGLRELIQTLTGKRIIVSCFSSNIARINSLLQIGKSVGRKVLFIGKSMHRMCEAARAINYIQPELEEYVVTPDNMVADDKLLIVCTGSQAEQGSVLDKLASCGSYNPVQLSPNNKIKTAIIFSARIIPGRTLAIEELKAKLIKRGAETYDTFEHKSIHVSGHPSQPEIKFICDLARPKYAIPVHGTQLLIQHAKKVFKTLNLPCIVPHNGCVIRLGKDSAEIISDVHVRAMGLDGKKLKPIDMHSSCIQSRREIGQEGVISICYEEGKLLSIHSLGCLPPQITQSEMFIGLMRNIIRSSKNSAMIINKIKQTVLMKYGKQPGVILHNRDIPTIKEVEIDETTDETDEKNNDD